MNGRFRNATIVAILVAVLIPGGAADHASPTDDADPLIREREAYVPVPIAMEADRFLWASPWEDNSQHRQDVLVAAERVIEDFIDDPTRARLEQEWSLVESDYDDTSVECLDLDVDCKDICFWTEYFPNYDLHIDGGPPVVITTPMVVPYGPNDSGTQFWGTSWGWGGGEITADANIRCGGL